MWKWGEFDDGVRRLTRMPERVVYHKREPEGFGGWTV